MCDMLRGCKLRSGNRPLGVDRMQGSCGSNVIQENSTSCMIENPNNICTRGRSGISKVLIAPSDQPASLVSGGAECRESNRPTSMVGDAAVRKELQERLDQLGVHASSRTCAAVVRIFRTAKFCLHAKRIYNLIVETTNSMDKCLDSLLVQLCIEDKALHQAWVLAAMLPDLNLLVWNCLIGSYARQELCMEVYRAFALMQRKGVSPDKVTFVNILSVCNSPLYLERGKCVHHIIIYMGCAIDVILGTVLLTMYSKCGSLKDTAKVFTFLEDHNVVSWTVMIGTYAKEQHSAKAFHLHDQMRQEGILPNRVTFLNLLEACSCEEALVNGNQLHCCIITGLDFDLHMDAALVNMYGKCGSFKDAQDLFNHKREMDVVMWNALIAASIRHKQYEGALQLFYSMINKGMVPSVVTYITIVPACVQCCTSTGKSMHVRVLSNGFQDNVVVTTALMSMYGRLGSLDTALLLFDNMKEQNVISWNTMIALHAESGAVDVALQFLDKMQLQGVWVNNVTYVSSLEAFADNLALSAGKRLHCLILESGYGMDVVVSTAVVNMYCRCGDLEEGYKVFNDLPVKSLISWNTMVLACDRYRRGLQGFHLFKQMQLEGILPDRTTFTSMLSICANQLVLLTLGRALHEYVMQSGCENSTVVAIYLLDMYGKCGSLQDAHMVFSKMSKQSIVSWNVMISTYAQHSYVGEAIVMVDLMQQQGVTPNNVTFLSLLSACSHTGMLFEAYQNLLCMTVCGIKAMPELFRCFVDLLGRAGQVEEAVEVLNKMPLDPSVIAWSSMLGACRWHAIDTKQVGHILEHILEYDPCNSAASIFLSSITN